MPSKQAHATYVPGCHRKTQHEKFYIPVPAWHFAMQRLYVRAAPLRPQSITERNYHLLPPILQRGGRESKPSAPTDNGQPAVFGRGVPCCLCRRYPYMSPDCKPRKKKGPPPGFPSLPLQPPRLSLFARLDGEFIREGSRGGVEWWSSWPSVGRNSSRRRTPDWTRLAMYLGRCTGR